MNLLILYSISDKTVASDIATKIQAAGANVYCKHDSPSMDSVGRYRIPKIEYLDSYYGYYGNKCQKFKSLPKIDAVIPLITKVSAASGNLQDEVSRANFNGIHINSIMYDTKFSPICCNFHPFTFIEKMQYFSPKGIIDNVSNAISDRNRREEVSLSKDILKKHNNDIESLKEAFYSRKLTLVCGAGVSRSSGLPLWKTLLGRLYGMYKYQYRKLEGFDDFELEKSINPYNSIYLGKCLKDSFGDEFFEKLYQALYYCHSENNEFIETILIESIIEICTKRDQYGSILDSIITFNYDSLVEDALKSRSIPFTPIYSEDVELADEQLPIYHIHGFMPLDKNANQGGIVFSEDEYHNLYNDNLSWVNQVQLEKLRNNTCLFVGVGLQDPNFRRLLYTIQSKRKSVYTPANHFIFRKSPKNRCEDDTIATRFLNEDSLRFGIKTIWVSHFSDISAILHAVVT